MSKLNKRGTNVTTNIRTVAAKREQELGHSANGNLQFKKQTHQMLYELVVTTMFGKSNMHKSSDKLVQEIKSNIKQIVDLGDYDFIANLAIHARTEMHIRTIPIIVVVEFAKCLSDKRASILAEIKTTEELIDKVKKQRKSTAGLKQILLNLKTSANVYNYENMRHLVADVIQRADQITDLFAYALEVFGNKKLVPMAIRRGVADAFNKFGEYAFSKYNRDGAVKFRDVLRIVHPVAKSVKQGVIFEKLMQETLETAYRWESELSANGTKSVDERRSKKEVWTELVSSGKMGYMALLRNLRNIHEADLEPSILRTHVLDVISDRDRVLKSKQLPYDFIEAYNVVLPLNPKMATAISKAIDHSVANIPQLGNKVWMIVDYSGSMGHDVSGGFGTGQTGSTSAITTATLLASYLLKANENADNLAVTMFGSSAKTIKGIDTNNSVLGIKKELMSHRHGSIAGSTNFHAALQEYNKVGFTPDTIVVLSDNEVNRFPYSALKVISKGDVLKLVVNMTVSQTTPMTQEDGWYSVAGWSTAMFKWVGAIRGKASVVEMLSQPYLGLPVSSSEPKVVETEDEVM